MVFGTCLIGRGGGMVGGGYLFASNKRTESIYQFSSNRAEWLWSVWSVRELFFFQNACRPDNREQ